MAYALYVPFLKQPGGEIVVKEVSFLSTMKKIQSCCFSKHYFLCVDSRTITKVRILPSKRKYMDYLKISESLITLNLFIWSAIRSKMQKKFTSLVVKFMQRFNFNATDVADLGYLQVDLTKVVHFCSHHDFEYKVNCARHNVKLVKKFLQLQKEW